MNKWNEKGVLESSVRYFYQVSQDAREYFFYPTWIGNYQCQFSYRIDRYYYPDFLVLFLNNGEFFLDYQQKKYHLKLGELFLLIALRNITMGP